MLLVASIVVGAASLLLNIVGLAIPYWIVWDYTENDCVSIGLWKACQNNETCVSLDSERMKMLDIAGVKATRALEVLAVLALATAVLGLILKLTTMKERRILPTLAGIAAIVAGVLGIIGCIVYASSVKPRYLSVFSGDQDMRLHAGFGLCIVSGIGGIAVGILAWLSNRNA